MKRAGIWTFSIVTMFQRQPIPIGSFYLTCVRSPTCTGVKRKQVTEAFWFALCIKQWSHISIGHRTTDFFSSICYIISSIKRSNRSTTVQGWEMYFLFVFLSKDRSRWTVHKVVLLTVSLCSVLTDHTERTVQASILLHFYWHNSIT